MTRTHKYICVALSLCYAVLCIAVLLMSCGLPAYKALIPVFLQIILFMLMGEKSLVSCSLSFLPATALAKTLEGASPVWQWICLGLAVAVYLLCRRPWPEARSTTANWVGACAIMVTSAIVVSIMLAA